MGQAAALGREQVSDPRLPAGPRPCPIGDNPHVTTHLELDPSPPGALLIGKLVGMEKQVCSERGRPGQNPLHKRHTGTHWLSESTHGTEVWPGNSCNVHARMKEGGGSYLRTHPSASVSCLAGLPGVPCYPDKLRFKAQLCHFSYVNPKKRPGPLAPQPSVHTDHTEGHARTQHSGLVTNAAHPSHAVLWENRLCHTLAPREGFLAHVSI